MRTVGASRCTNTDNLGRLRPDHEPRSLVRGARRISSDERTAVARQLIICLCRGLIQHLFVLAALAVGACAGAAGGAAGGAACRRSSVVARTVVARTVVARTVVARTVVARTVVARTVVAWTVVVRTVVAA